MTLKCFGRQSKNFFLRFCTVVAKSLTHNPLRPNYIIRNKVVTLSLITCTTFFCQGTTNLALMYSCFAAVGVTGVLATLLLPETFQKPLAECVQVFILPTCSQAVFTNANNLLHNLYFTYIYVQLCAQLFHCNQLEFTLKF